MILLTFNELLLGCALALALSAYLVGQRKARAAQHREMLRSRSLLDYTQTVAHLGTWEVDLGTTRVSWSDEMYRIVGLAPQSQPATFELFLAHVHGDDLALVTRAFDEATRTGEFEFECRVVIDELVRYVRGRGQATMRDGVVARMLGTVLDLTDSKATVQALEAARLQQKLLIDNLPDLVFLKDRESRFVAVNEPLARIFGVSADDMIGKTDFDFFPTEQAMRYAADDMWAMSRGDPLVSEEQVIGGDGAVSWMETTMSPYRDSESAWAGIVGVTRDVTARNAAAELLRQSARHYQLLFDRNPLPMWVFDCQTLRFLSVNDAAIEHYGYDRETFLRMRITDIRPDDQRDALELALVQPSNAKSEAGQFVHVTKEGRRIDVEVIADSIIINGRPARLVLARDITLQLFAVSALRESEARYRTLFVESLAGNYISTVDGRLLACNPTFARMMGFDSPEEACQHSTGEYYPNASSRLSFLALVRERKRLELHEDSLQRRDGSILQILENVIGQFDADGELVEIHGFVLDVTDRKRLEDQLRHSQKLQAIGQLAGGIAHDFNNLLTAMKLHGELLLNDMEADSPYRTDVLEMQLAADRATLLTRQLLAFSRKQILKPEVISANAVIEGMAPMVRRLIGEDVTVNIVLDPAAGNVMADPGQVEQVILNLAVNARDAMSRGGTFTIASGIMILDPSRAGIADLPAGSYVSLTASDTGCGMTAEVLTHIFEPFYTTKDQGKGTGLGLATVYGIVKQSGGHIWVSSVPEMGTSFEILLPRVNELPADVVVAPTAPRGTETILVVEDDLAVQALTRRFLERQGYTVLVASDGGQALECVAVAEAQFALVLTDVVMPQMSGTELAARLAVTQPELPVMFVSGYTDDEIVRRGLLDASAIFLQKPFTATTLAHAVRDALDSRSLATIL
jgi:two-component system cell cycle sensor histidine kinase/response regulator CckA